ncbi:NUDIX domain-containing protein [Actinoplanes regularis]|uniref:8-oxo-dGTP diphosphatase n=1 Tax=Actinoplanes regularis TaxID=52697 RepID=A0A238Y3C0_9ACTN|nr:NUDIX domain-containing protein [Actinoplanes regularis]GIE86233.1 NUDIX hydrolase [Actinoplanes regularis]SNR65472.1 8-oxo-dGTP diphosphatase [Actinoplanes regularis]
MIERPHLSFELAVDLVVCTVRGAAFEVLLVERGVEPYLGRLALPGGFLRAGEDLIDAAVRELAEETGLSGLDPYLEQVRTYAAPDRDPRGRVATVAYLAILPDLPMPTAGTDAAGARWEPVRRGGLGLAFDHDRILADAVEQARRLLENTPLATAFCRTEFTIAELRAVYEAVWGVPLDPRNFHRKATGLPGFVVPTGEMRSPPTGRPAALFRRGPATALYPPLQRPA